MYCKTKYIKTNAMMRNLLLCTGLLFSMSTYAQVGNVGINTPDPMATLDIVGKADDASRLDGVIAPRITGDQLQSKSYTASQTGAILYVTAAASSLTGQVVKVTAPGYYYFDGVLWQMMSNPGNDWHVDGNANTNTSTHFLGTTDAVDLVIKTNNRERLRITQTGRLAFYNTSGNNSNIFLEGGNETLTGTFNTAIGKNSLYNIITGSQNTAVGAFSLLSINVGSNNVSVGNNAMRSATSASFNTVMGFRSGQLITGGNGNTLYGKDAGANVTTGNANVIIGSDAGTNITTGAFNIAMGTSALLAQAEASYQMNIGNNIFGTGLSGSITAPAGNIGIGSASPKSTLEVMGSFGGKITVLSSGTVGEKDFTVLVSGDIALPAPSVNNKGRIYRLILDGNTTRTVSGLFYWPGSTGSQNDRTMTVADNMLEVQSDATRWIILRKSTN